MYLSNVKSASFLGLCFISSQVFAQVSPSKFFHVFDPKSPPVVNIDVQNQYTDKEVRVEVDSFRVIMGQDGNEIKDTQNNVIVSPKSFTLAPKGKRTVRVVLKNKPKDVEDVYRVQFKPVSQTQMKPKAKEANSGVKLNILVGSGVLVFAPPLSQTAKVRWEKKGEEYEFTNIGNVNVMLIGCQSAEDCKSGGNGGRIYPGQKTLIKANFEHEKQTNKNAKKSSKDSPLVVARYTIKGTTENFTVNTGTGEYTFKN